MSLFLLPPQLTHQVSSESVHSFLRYCAIYRFSTISQWWRITLKIRVVGAGSGLSPKSNQFVLVTPQTYPHNFIQIRPQDFAISCTQTNKQTARNGWKHNLLHRRWQSNKWLNSTNVYMVNYKHERVNPGNLISLSAEETLWHVVVVFICIWTSRVSVCWALQSVMFPCDEIEEMHFRVNMLAWKLQWFLWNNPNQTRKVQWNDSV